MIWILAAIGYLLIGVGVGRLVTRSFYSHELDEFLGLVVLAWPAFVLVALLEGIFIALGWLAGGRD